MPKLIYEGHNSKKIVVEGVKHAADIITTTYGGQGGVVMSQPLHGPATFTKDGFSVSKQVQFVNRLKNIGAQFVQEACDKIAFQVGDGTTTMAEILSAFVDVTFKHELAGTFNRDIAVALKYGIDQSLDLLSHIAIKIKKDDYTSIRSVALVSANYDEEVATFIEDAYKSINKHMDNSNPVILIEESKTEKSKIDIVEGMQLQRGIFSPHFFTKEEKITMKIELNNQPYVMVFGKSIGMPDIQKLLQLHILEEIIKQGKSCLILASDFTEEAINFFLINRHSNCICIKTPGYGDGQLAQAQDIAIRTGGKVLCENGALLSDNTVLADCVGIADKICIDKDTTVIVGGKGNAHDIKQRCETLREEIRGYASKGSTYHVEQTNLRIQSLIGVVCIIKLGGLSEMKIKETKDRVEDASYATKHALNSGIVPGGGIDLLYVAMKLEEKLEKEAAKLSKIEKLGLEIMIIVCKKPFYKLVRSCGLSGGVCAERVWNKFLATKKLEHGIDVRTGELINFIERGILNPAAVSVGVFNVAKEMVHLFIMCNVFIADSTDEEKGLKEGFNTIN